MYVASDFQDVSGNLKTRSITDFYWPNKEPFVEVLCFIYLFIYFFYFVFIYGHFIYLLYCLNEHLIIHFDVTH